MSKKIKILFQLNQLGYGGTEKAVLTFLENIDLNKFVPYLYFNTNKGSFDYFRIKLLSFLSKQYSKKYNEKYIISFARLNNFKIILNNNLFMGNGYNDFKRIVYKLDPNIIHFNRGIERDFYTERINELPFHIKIVETNIFGKSSNINYLKRLDKIFFVSNWLKNKSDWAKGYPIGVLYNPIKKNSTNKTLHKELNIPSNVIVLGRISRPNLDDGKFISNILEQVLNKQTLFVSIGSSNKFKDITRNKNNIINLEPTTDTIFIDKFYNTIDILLHYRLEGETFGMNIAEAMIHGKTVISHFSQEDNAQEELILRYSDCGYVTNLELNEYSEKLKILIENKEKRIFFSENAKKVASKLFSEEKVIKELENHYINLTKK